MEASLRKAGRNNMHLIMDGERSEKPVCNVNRGTKRAGEDRLSGWHPEELVRVSNERRVVV